VKKGATPEPVVIIPGSRKDAIRKVRYEKPELRAAPVPVLIPNDSEYGNIDGTEFEDVLRRGCMAVVKSAYFKDCWEKRSPFKDRSNIPPEFIFDGDEAVRRWKEFGNAFLLIVSYPWLSQRHPDPDLFHLQRLTFVLEQLKKFMEVQDEESLGVILDYCSLWQNLSEKGEPDSRTPEQLQDFSDGLKRINTPYGHQDVTALKLTLTPATENRKYDDRGWTLFESTVINGKGKGQIAEGRKANCNVICVEEEFDERRFDMTWCNQQVGKLDKVGYVGKGNNIRLHRTCARFIEVDLQKSRGAPLTPSHFNDELAKRGQNAAKKGVNLFTSGKDQPFIITKYEDAFKELCKATSFGYASTEWTDAELDRMDRCWTSFFEVMSCAKRLQSFSMSDCKMSDDIVERLAKHLGGSDTLTDMTLNKNELGPGAGVALAKALEATRSITSVDLSGNLSSCRSRLGTSRQGEKVVNVIWDKGGAAIAKALEINSTVTSIKLKRNDLGPGAGEAFAKVIQANGPLTSLDLSENKLANPGTSALVKALPANFTITHLDLGENELTPGLGACISEALQANSTITSIDFLNNHYLGHTDAIEIAKTLEVNTTITRLNLSYCMCLTEEATIQESDSPIIRKRKEAFISERQAAFITLRAVPAVEVD